MMGTQYREIVFLNALNLPCFNLVLFSKTGKHADDSEQVSLDRERWLINSSF